jgi:hypothetical protein
MESLGNFISNLALGCFSLSFSFLSVGGRKNTTLNDDFVKLASSWALSRVCMILLVPFSLPSKGGLP